MFVGGLIGAKIFDKSIDDDVEVLKNSHTVEENCIKVCRRRRMQDTSGSICMVQISLQSPQYCVEGLKVPGDATYMLRSRVDTIDSLIDAKT